MWKDYVNSLERSIALAKAINRNSNHVNSMSDFELRIHNLRYMHETNYKFSKHLDQVCEDADRPKILCFTGHFEFDQITPVLIEYEKLERKYKQRLATEMDFNRLLLLHAVLRSVYPE